MERPQEYIREDVAPTGGELSDGVEPSELVTVTADPISSAELAALLRKGMVEEVAAMVGRTIYRAAL